MSSKTLGLTPHLVSYMTKSKYLPSERKESSEKSSEASTGTCARGCPYLDFVRLTTIKKVRLVTQPTSIHVFYNL